MYYQILRPAPGCGIHIVRHPVTLTSSKVGKRMGAEAFGVRETHGILWQKDNALRADSDGSRWRAVCASAQRDESYEARFAAVPDHPVILHRDGPVPVGGRLGAGCVQCVVPEGGLFVLPGGMDPSQCFSFARVTTPAAFPRSVRA